MKRLIICLLLTIFAVGSTFSLTQYEKQELLDRYLKGESFSPEDLAKLSELRSNFDSTGVNKPEIPEQEKDLKEGSHMAGEEERTLSTEEISFFNKYYFSGEKGEYDPRVQDLKLFGGDFFDAPGTFAPLDNIPVNDSYILGPGDTLFITIWGSTNNQYEVTVNNNGNISSAELGRIPVAGLSFGELKNLLSQNLMEGSDMEISLSGIKTIRVFITGDARSPGSYTISGLATMINAVFASGGPSPTGSLRNIMLKRKGRAVKKMDLYSFILEGSSAGDAQLLPGDVIFIPPVGKLIAVSGSVKRPAIYEAADNETLEDILGIAGGLTASAYDADIYIERFKKNSGKTVLTIDASAVDLDTVKLKDGDIVKIFPVPETRISDNFVELRGYVSAPRKFQYREGMKVSDLISADLLLQDTYMKYASVSRKKYPENIYETLPLNLYSAVIARDSEGDIELQPEDIVVLYSKYDMMDRAPVFALGEVRMPGSFPFQEGMTALDLIHSAGGLKNTANLETGEYVTLVISGDMVESVTVENFSPGFIFEQPNNPDVNFPLKPFDKIFIRKVANFEDNRAITLNGEITYPGVYFAKKDDRLYDILKRAGGFTSKACLRALVFTRESIREQSKKRLEEIKKGIRSTIETTKEAIDDYPEAAAVAATYTSRLETLENSEASGRMVMELPGNLEDLKDSPYNITIRNGDKLYVPEKPNSVMVMGEVNNPSTFIYSPDHNRVKDYIRMTGGATSRGNLDGTFVIKASGKIISKYYVDSESRNITFFRNKLLNSKIFPGDIIIVPVKDFKVPWISRIKDWTTVLYQLASTVKITSDVWNE